MSQKSAEGCICLIFGGSGDLSKRLLLPSLYHLATENLLPTGFAVVGMGRAPMSDDSYRHGMLERLKSIPGVDLKCAETLIKDFRYFQGDSTEDRTYSRLKAYLDQLGRERGTNGSILFYLATPPHLFNEIPKRLKNAGLLAENQGAWRRLVIEKPFGRDLASAVALNNQLLECLKETQIYRIDHYLGKETVQNILSVRLGNGILEPLWNRQYIESVRVTVAETLGVEDRAAYYDPIGALRDMVPNHLFQVVSLIAMEPPNSFSADDLRDEKAKVLRAAVPFLARDVKNWVIRAQYGRGQIGSQEVPGYREEPGIPKNSMTETFVAMRMMIDNWRWAGVPFYLQTGKRLPKKLTEVAIRFKSAPKQLFQNTECKEIQPNSLIFQIMPEEQIKLFISAKIPGPTICLAETPLSLDYRQAFGRAPETGYETLLYDVMCGDATLFQRADQIEAGWRLVDPITQSWSESSPSSQDNPLIIYPAGKWGALDDFTNLKAPLERDGKLWKAA